MPSKSSGQMPCIPMAPFDVYIAAVGTGLVVVERRQKCYEKLKEVPDTSQVLAVLLALTIQG